MGQRSLLPEDEPVRRVDASDAGKQPPGTVLTTAAQFRPISWDEWFDNFTPHDLMFVYEGDVPGQTPSGRYRLVPREKLIQRRPADHGPQEPGHSQ